MIVTLQFHLLGSDHPPISIADFRVENVTMYDILGLVLDLFGVHHSAYPCYFVDHGKHTVYPDHDILLSEWQPVIALLLEQKLGSFT